MLVEKDEEEVSVAKAAAGCFSSMLVVKQSIVPPSTEDLIRTVENNQTTIMFFDRGDIAEKILRSTSIGHRLLEKYPPIYINDLVTNWYGRQTPLVRKICC
jgi:hypothetical protein